MDFSQIISKSKFLFDWGNQDPPQDFKVTEVGPDFLTFNRPLSDRGEVPPRLTISVKVRHRWHEHEFNEMRWKKNETGQLIGLELSGDQEKMLEWRKSLELGLCV